MFEEGKGVVVQRNPIKRKKFGEPDIPKPRGRETRNWGPTFRKRGGGLRKKGNEGEC